MTRIVACLAWFDEPPEFLDRCVRSLAGVADVLVAVDGPWHGFPHQTWDSHHEEIAIASAAGAAGVELVLITKPEWSSQVEKRDWMMRFASQRGDWLLVVDADEWIAPPVSQGDFQEMRFATSRDILATTTRDVATVTCIHHSLEHRNGRPIRRIYRAPITVEHAHNGYRTADGRWLHGDPSRVTLEPTVATPLILNHAPLERSPQRNQARAAYRAHRRSQQLERWP